MSLLMKWVCLKSCRHAAEVESILIEESGRTSGVAEGKMMTGSQSRNTAEVSRNRKVKNILVRNLWQAGTFVVSQMIACEWNGLTFMVWFGRELWRGWGRMSKLWQNPCYGMALGSMLGKSERGFFGGLKRPISSWVSWPIRNQDGQADPSEIKCDPQACSCTTGDKTTIPNMVADMGSKVDKSKNCKKTFRSCYTCAANLVGCWPTAA